MHITNYALITAITIFSTHVSAETPKPVTRTFDVTVTLESYGSRVDYEKKTTIDGPGKRVKSWAVTATEGESKIVATMDLGKESAFMTQFVSDDDTNPQVLTKVLVGDDVSSAGSLCTTSETPAHWVNRCITVKKEGHIALRSCVKIMVTCTLHQDPTSKDGEGTILS